MEIANTFLKKTFSFSLLEFSIFAILGVLFYAILVFLYKFVYCSLPLSLLSSLSCDLKDVNKFPANLFFFIFWCGLFIGAKRIFSWITKRNVSSDTYIFKPCYWPREWEWQGNIRLYSPNPDYLHITDSNSGCILKNHYWKNLEINIECMFPEGVNDPTFGIIFRAQDLSNYLMVQVNGKDKDIRPHIRMDGYWETPRQGTYPIKSLKTNVFYSVKFRTINEKVELFIDNKKLLNWRKKKGEELKIPSFQQ